jgi:WD40 repeat protein
VDVRLEACGLCIKVPILIDGEVRVWDRQSDDQKGTALTKLTSTVRALRFSPDGTKLVAGGEGRELQLYTYSGTAWSEPRKLAAHETDIRFIFWDRDGLISGSETELVWWDEALTAPKQKKLLPGGQRAYSMARARRGYKAASSR